jgi:hypothetical protein
MVGLTKVDMQISEGKYFEFQGLINLNCHTFLAQNIVLFAWYVETKSKLYLQKKVKLIFNGSFCTTTKPTLGS